MEPLNRDLWRSLEAQRSRLEQAKENTGRLARHAVSYTSHGYGDILIPDPVTFDCLFIAEPSVVTGAAIESPTPAIGKIPIITAGVYEWDIDDSGLYRGAYLFVSVISRESGVANSVLRSEPLRTSVGTNFTINHHWVFETVALKKAPEHVLQNVPAVRSMGGLG